MYLIANFAAASLTAAAIGFYVLGYTVWLKPRTNQNIVWGGIAGCFPVVIAEAIVIGEVTIKGWMLFLLIFFWTPAHYWPLAAHFKHDYAEVGIPMLPVEKSMKIVASWTLIYTLLTIATSFLVYLVLGLGNIYLITALVAGVIFLVMSSRYLIQSHRGDGANSLEIFHFSITYLAVIFVALAIDVLL
jgi:protoheme IX farnesyltransferase